MSDPDFNSDAWLDARLRGVPLPDGLMVRLERVVAVGDEEIDAELRNVCLPSSLLWRLSEDALAALIAHEIAHEALGHKDRFERLEKEQGQPGYALRLRAIELAADTFAGRLLARTGYDPDGFGELLGHVRSTEWETPLVRQYYPHVQRLSAFQDGYERGRPVETVASKKR